MPNRIAIVLKGYPRLSETFIAQEILGLERAGFDLQLISMRHPTDVKRHPVHNEISAPVLYLPEYLHDEPLRVARAAVQSLFRPGFAAAFRIWLADLPGDFTRNRFRRFGQALVLASELPEGIAHLHAHFIHTPGDVTRYTSLLTGLTWTCSAHAKDIWTSKPENLRRKLGAARWVVTCTKNGWRHLRGLAPRPDSIHLSYHGLDLSRFPSPPETPSKRDGSDPADPVRLLCVCRAVEKKGLDVLLRALARLPDNLNWRLTHIGGGTLVDNLKHQTTQLGLADRVEWSGPRDQSEVLDAYRASDLFVLPCRIAADGDRDGLPNVIVEALSQRLCCLSTDVSGVPELIDDGETGRLVPSEDPEALGAALAELIGDPAARASMARTGEQRVRGQFDMHASIATLKELFTRVLDTSAARS